MKKSGMLMGMLLIWNMAVAAGAQEITLSRESGLPGETVRVTVSLSEGSAASGMAFRVAYDTAVLEFEGVEGADLELVSDESLVPGDTRMAAMHVNSLFYKTRVREGGVLSVAAVSPAAFPEGGLMHLAFRIREGAFSGTSSLSLEENRLGLDASGERIPVLFGLEKGEGETFSFKTHSTELHGGTVTVLASE